MQIPYLVRTAALLSALTWFGCATMPRTIVPCPLTYSEQEKVLLTAIPKGLKRDEVLRRLGAAGIEGRFGISQRVYYCDLWNRPNGDRWHMNVAMLFDDTGKFYKTQVAECDIGVMPTDTDHGTAANTNAQNKPQPTQAEAAALTNPKN
jgi:hypothetical protein